MGPTGPWRSSRFERFQRIDILRPVPATLEYERMLRDAGLRVTQPRLAVLTAVHDRPHADTNSIVEAARENLGEATTITT